MITFSSQYILDSGGTLTFQPFQIYERPYKYQRQATTLTLFYYCPCRCCLVLYSG